jgi:hypothetical protein
MWMQQGLNLWLQGERPAPKLFYGCEGVIMGSIMGSQNIMGSDYGSIISVTIIQTVETNVVFKVYTDQRLNADV